MDSDTQSDFMWRVSPVYGHSVRYRVRIIDGTANRVEGLAGKSKTTCTTPATVFYDLADESKDRMSEFMDKGKRFVEDRI